MLSRTKLSEKSSVSLHFKKNLFKVLIEDTYFCFNFLGYYKSHSLWKNSIVHLEWEQKREIRCHYYENSFDFWGSLNRALQTIDHSWNHLPYRLQRATLTCENYLLLYLFRQYKEPKTLEPLIPFIPSALPFTLCFTVIMCV